ncbi:MAG: TolC family protein [Candidatus Omnitrophica bacterium]|nr:TolC family protein [Candidatus Omnitrophota bacterium]
MDDSGYLGREQEVQSPMSEDFSSTRLLPEFKQEMRRREQETESANGRAHYIKDWVHGGTIDETLKSHPLIYSPEGLNLPDRKKQIESAFLFSLNGQTRPLEECIQRAIETHLPLEIAAQRQRISATRIRVALRELFPELELEYKNDKGSNTTGTFKGRSWRVNGRQPIFRGGQLWNAFREERENFKSAAKEHDETLNEVIFKVSEAYLNLHRAQKILIERSEINKIAIRWRDVSLQKSRAALISEVERLNVEAIYYEQMAQLEIARQDIEIARLELQHWLNLEVPNEIQVADFYDLPTLMKDETFITSLGAEQGGGAARENVKSLDDYIQLAYVSRPELELNVHRVKANQYAELAERGAWLPNVDLIAEVGQLFEVATHIDSAPKFGSFGDEKEYRFGIEGNYNFLGSTVKAEYDNTHNAPNLTSFAGGGEGTTRRETTFSIALLDNLEQFADTEEAQVETKEAIQELQEAEKQVIEDVKNAYYDYHKARLELISLLRRLDHRERLTKLAEVRLEKNEIQISEYLQSLIDLTSDRIQMHRSISDFFIAKARLNRAVGIQNLLTVEDLYA